IFEASLPLDGTDNAGKSIPPHVTHRLGPRAVGPDRPLPAARHRVEQGRRPGDLATDLPRLVIDVQRPAIDPAAHQHRRVNGKAPVRAKAQDGVVGRLELLDPPVAEYA